MEAIFKLGNVYFDLFSIVGIVMILVQMIKGYKRGFVYNVINSLKGIVSFIVAYSLEKRMTIILGHFEILSNLTDKQLVAVSFISCLLACLLIFSIILKLAIKINDDKHVGKLNKLLGGLLGFVIAYISFDILIYLVTSFMMVNASFQEFYTNTMYLNSEGIFTFSKFVYENGIIKTIISALLS